MRSTFFLISLALLSACTSLPPAQPTSIDWQSHQSAINDLQQWQLQGRLNIRTEDDSNTISITWQQNDDSYLINLSGTLGMGAVKIEGNNQGLIIEKSGEEPVFANNLEEVSLNYLGYEFPGSQLQYWVRGIPSPDSSNIITSKLNEKGLLESLQQNEWQLHYERYQEQDAGLNMPRRITMEHSAYRLTFIISRWQL